MPTPVFKFQHPDLPGEDLYFIHNTFFELPETIPMDLSSFIWYHLNSRRTLEGFFAAWDNLNKFQTSLEGHSFEEYFNENEKKQLYDDAIFGQSLQAAQVNQRVTLELKEFIDLEKYKTESISDSLCRSVGKTNYGVIKVSFFYSRHYFMQYIWDNFNNKLEESYSYMSDREIILALINFNGLGLSFADENLKKDREVLLKAIKNDFRAFHFVDNSLKENKTFILEALKVNYWVCSLLNEKFKKDADILFETGKQECLFFFKKEIENIEATEYSFRYNSQEVYDEDSSPDTIEFYNTISNEIEESLLNLKKYAEDGPFFFVFEYSFSYELLKNDEDYILNLFKLWPHYLVDYNIFYSVASSRLLQSKEFITELLKSETKGSVLWSWNEFPISYWSDDEFVKAAIKVNGNALQYANDSYKKDKTLVIQALKSSKKAIQFVDESLKKDEDVLALISITPIEIKDSEENEDLPF
jgi:hypothetical protein